MRNTIQTLVTWVTLAALLNSLWELAQLPLYGLWQDPDPNRIVLYLLHCILGDVSIATVLFLLTSVVLKSLEWPVVYPWRGGALVIGLGLAYTAFSEWRNVHVVNAWSYAPSMPLISGIGVAPLLQWFLVPALMIFAFRRLR